MPDTDSELIRRYLAGDRAASARLVERHSARGMALAVRMLGAREDAEEALQDAFLRAFNALDRFDARSSFATWFYRIVHNVCANAIRRRSILRESPNAGSEFEIDALAGTSDQTPDRILEHSELDSVVRAAVDRTPPEFAEAITLLLFHEMTYEEIATVTGAPMGTVKARIFRARALLRDALRGTIGASRAVTLVLENDR
jgi:RNA polymerase sigma-70 factor (ECF subfamily)